jgi:hypothetical protein
MNKQRLNDDVTETDIELDTDALELDSSSEILETKDVVQMSRYTARRKIEDLKEELRLRKDMASYDDWD